MRPTDILHDLARYLNDLFSRAAAHGTCLNGPQRVFARRLLVGLVTAGTVLLSEIVRHFPASVAIKHRYKGASRMLGNIKLVPVASEQTAILGAEVGDGHVIAIDFSDIRKHYGQKMPLLAEVRDGSTGEIGMGYGLVTAAAVDVANERKSVPVPLLFDVYSTVSDDFVSEPALWLRAIDRVCDATKGGVIAIDRAGDNGRIIRRLVERKRKYVLRMLAGDTSRSIEFGGRIGRVRDLWRSATWHGEIEATRIDKDGRRSTYRCRYGSMLVKIPKFDQDFWLCIFDSPAHSQPMVLLTQQDAKDPNTIIKVLGQYFARWGVEELHRFAKQEFDLENIRSLTWSRLENLVATVWIALGAISRFGLQSASAGVIQRFEIEAQRLGRRLEDHQFWGYAIARGIRSLLRRNPASLNLLPSLWRPRELAGPQLELALL